jgi:hypothetical protein
MNILKNIGLTGASAHLASYLKVTEFSYKKNKSINEDENFICFECVGDEAEHLLREKTALSLVAKLDTIFEKNFRCKFYFVNSQGEKELRFVVCTNLL